MKKTTRTIFSLAIALIALTGASLASAAPVTWNLLDISFDDGGSASGSFVFDADTETVLSWDITTLDSVNPNLPTPFTFTNTNPHLIFVDGPGDFAGLNGHSIIFNDGTTTSGGARQLRFATLSPLTNAGGTVGLDLALFAGDSNIECNNCGSPRYITGGFLTTNPIPLPASVLLLGSALGGLVLRRRKTG